MLYHATLFFFFLFFLLGLQPPNIRDDVIANPRLPSRAANENTSTSTVLVAQAAQLTYLRQLL
jgi:hypothetical protein